MILQHFRGWGRSISFSENGYSHKVHAFTLAEVLITLGIIGIVAAMTLPALVSKYNEYITINRLKKVYSELSNAVKLSEAMNGSVEYWVFDEQVTTENSAKFAEKYILPYLTKSYTRCKSKCFDGKSNWLKPDGADSGETAFAHYRYNDKTISIKQQSADCTLQAPYYCSERINYATIVVDIDGDRGRSIMGRDVFLFTLFSYTYRSGGWVNTGICKDGKHYGLYFGSIAGYWGGYCMELDALFEGNPGTCRLGSSGADCGLAIQKNNWEVPDKYPIKF